MFPLPSLELLYSRWIFGGWYLEYCNQLRATVELSLMFVLWIIKLSHNPWGSHRGLLLFTPLSPALFRMWSMEKSLNWWFTGSLCLALCSNMVMCLWLWSDWE